MFSALTRKNKTSTINRWETLPFVCYWTASTAHLKKNRVNYIRGNCDELTIFCQYLCVLWWFCLLVIIIFNFLSLLVPVFSPRVVSSCSSHFHLILIAPHNFSFCCPLSLVCASHRHHALFLCLPLFFFHASSAAMPDFVLCFIKSVFFILHQSSSFMSAPWVQQLLQNMYLIFCTEGESQNELYLIKN